VKRPYLTGYEARGDRPKRATEVLQTFLGESLQALHASCSRVLMRSVEATIAGRRLTRKPKASGAKEPKG
jgi:hypothetical protein